MGSILAHHNAFATNVFTTARWRTSESNDRLPYSHHPYAYALGNPVVFTDPSGKCIDERVPVIGEPGCRVEEGVLKGQLDWAAGQAYVEGIGSTVSECGAGAFKQWAYDNTFGLSEDAAPQSGESTAMTICRHAGNAVAAVQGAAEIAAGAGGIGGSGAACVGTVGLACAPAAVIGAASATVTVHGAGVLGAALGNEGALLANGLCATTNGQGSGNSTNANPSAYQTAKDRVLNSGRPAISARYGGSNPIIAPNDLQISTGGRFKVKPNVKYLYIIDDAGNLRIAEELHPVRGVKHTQLSAEGPVYGAGEVWFDAAGKVEKINAQSGRYMAQPFAYQYIQVSLDDAKALFSALGH